jgi:Fic family protein
MAISEKELADVETILRDRPDGVSMMDFVGRTATDAKRRSMQRRLKRLIQLGRARSTGTNKSTRYFLVGQPVPTTLLHKEDAHIDAEGGLFIPLSVAGQELQKQINRPESERTPVGYNRKFLSDYQPNTTFYLSPKERQYLARVGVVATESGQPAGTYANQILDRLLIDLSWNSSRLEGNTYSILDTHLLLERGKLADGKSPDETQMILNHKDAIEFLVESANEIGFNRHTILNLHALLSNNLLPDPQASGRLRRGIVGIGKSVYKPLETPSIVEECFMELLKKADAISDPFEQSIFVTIQLPYLQPFEDVNKRVSRLAANIPFVKKNISPISFIDVPEQTYIQAMLSIYELNKTDLARDMFVWAYERSARRYAAIQQSIGSPDPFRLRYREQLRAAVAEVIRDKLDKSAASRTIDNFAKQAIARDDRPRFIEIAETELMGLHEGNFARYRIRPSEFFGWKAVWESET